VLKKPGKQAAKAAKTLKAQGQGIRQSGEKWIKTIWLRKQNLKSLLKLEGFFISGLHRLSLSLLHSMPII
jgi:hypothetical protein